MRNIDGFSRNLLKRAGDGLDEEGQRYLARIRANAKAMGSLIDANANYTASVRSVIEGVREGRGQSIVMLGLLVLIATPVVRVAASVVLFAAEHDRVYVAITSVVLTLLLLSFVIGTAG